MYHVYVASMPGELSTMYMGVHVLHIFSLWNKSSICIQVSKVRCLLLSSLKRKHFSLSFLGILEKNVFVFFLSSLLCGDGSRGVVKIICAR
jgi:hypothetical protein